MSFNSDLARRLAQTADMLELLGEDRFKVNAHARAARVIGDHGADLRPIADQPGELTKIDGIGAKMAAKIGEFAATGEIGEHKELLTRVPPGLLDVLDVPGLGPKTVKALWETLGVTGIDDLKRVIVDGSILKVPRMGAKTVENITKSLATVESGAGRLNIGVATPIAEMLVARLEKTTGVERVQFAGSLRRGKETIGDIDLLVVAPGPGGAEAAREAFCAMPEVKQVLARGETKCSARLELDGVHVQADMRLVPAGSWGAALMYFTGSKDHNVRLRERALKKKLTLNEYGLFHLDDDPTPHQHREGGLGKAVAGKTESDVYSKLGLPFIPPELREDQGELDREVPELIEIGDIKSELHAHTTASDGVMSIVRLAEHAKARGFHTIAVTDHSKSSVIANGLSPERLREHIKGVHAAREEVRGIHILAGSEVDILADGRLDYDDDLLAALDIVVASPHASLRQEPAKATQRLLKAITHPLVHIIGHPTGRIIGQRDGLEPDMKELCAAAAEHKTALEINASWQRLDLRDAHVRLAMERGCMIAIDCDVHAPEDSDNLRYGVVTGRRGGLTAERCVNTWTRARLEKWLKSKR